jgi:hypothetical protein
MRLSKVRQVQYRGTSSVKRWVRRTLTLRLYLTVPHEFALDMGAGNQRHCSRSTVSEPIEPMARHAGLLAELPELLCNRIPTPRLPEQSHEDVLAWRSTRFRLSFLCQALFMIPPDFSKQLACFGPEYECLRDACFASWQCDPIAFDMVPSEIVDILGPETAVQRKHNHRPELAVSPIK